MAEAAEQLPTAGGSGSGSASASASASGAATPSSTSGHEPPHPPVPHFVAPSSYLRPKPSHRSAMAHSPKPPSPLDKEQAQGLVRVFPLPLLHPTPSTKHSYNACQSCQCVYYGRNEWCEPARVARLSRYPRSVSQIHGTCANWTGTINRKLFENSSKSERATMFFPCHSALSSLIRTSSSRRVSIY